MLFARHVDPPFLGPIRRDRSWGSVLLWTPSFEKKYTYFKRVQKTNSECDQDCAKGNCEGRLGGTGVVFSAVKRRVCVVKSSVTKPRMAVF